MSLRGDKSELYSVQEEYGSSEAKAVVEECKVEFSTGLHDPHADRRAGLYTLAI